MAKLKPKRKYTLSIETGLERSEAIEHVLHLAAEKLDGRLTRAELVPDPNASGSYKVKDRKTLRGWRKKR